MIRRIFKIIKKHKNLFNFIFCFIVTLISGIIFFKVYHYRGIGNMTWREIIYNLPLFIFFSLIFAFIFYISNYSSNKENDK